MVEGIQVAKSMFVKMYGYDPAQRPIKYHITKTYPQTPDMDCFPLFNREAIAST